MSLERDERRNSPNARPEIQTNTTEPTNIHANETPDRELRTLDGGSENGS